jgi:hypothetical protein
MNHLFGAEWITVHGLVALLAVAIFALGSRARGQRRHPSAAMAWVLATVAQSMALRAMAEVAVRFINSSSKVKVRVLYA